MVRHILVLETSFTTVRRGNMQGYMPGDISVASWEFIFKNLQVVDGEAG